MRFAEARLFTGRHLKMNWRGGSEIESLLERVFNRVLEQKMQDLPFVNPALSVRALDFSTCQHGWLGVLLTPWSMNLLLLPNPAGDWMNRTPGSKFELAFPYGRFEFTLAEHAELGRYGQCALFSDMLPFQDQEAALIAAKAAAEQLFAAEPPRAISRRNLLRGAFREPSL